jgi:hypothetical protein
VPDTEHLAAAFTALDNCDAALEQLEARCCEPGRSPRMRALGETLAAARRNIAGMAGREDAAAVALIELEDAGAQVGRLQVGCCAPSRLPLYVDMLEGLTKAQLSVNAELGRGH